MANEGKEAEEYVAGLSHDVISLIVNIALFFDFFICYTRTF